MKAAIFPTATTANSRGVKAAQLKTIIDRAMGFPRFGVSAATGETSTVYQTTTWHDGITHPTDGRFAVFVAPRLLTRWRLSAVHDALVPARITQAQYDAMDGTIADALAAPDLTSDWRPDTAAAMMKAAKRGTGDPKPQPWVWSLAILAVVWILFWIAFMLLGKR